MQLLHFQTTLLLLLLLLLLIALRCCSLVVERTANTCLWQGE